MIQARVEIPPGTPVVEADRVLQRMAAQIRENPEVIGVFTSMNGADGSAPDANMFIQLTQRDERNRSAYAIQQEMRPILSSIPELSRCVRARPGRLVRLGHHRSVRRPRSSRGERRS